MTVEVSQRLALGVEPIDAAREQPMQSPVLLTQDEAARGLPRKAFQRHPSNRQVLLYEAGQAAQILTLRLVDGDGRRRFIPRRLRIALPALAQAGLDRACRPWLFPAAAYPLSESVTGLRAHAMRGTAPARWAQVWATLPAGEATLEASTVVGRARCDERGEFVLLIRSHPLAQQQAQIRPEGSVLPVRLRVFSQPAAVMPLGETDPLWDLPIEPADSAAALRGEVLPPGVVQVTERLVDLPLGRLLRGQAPLTF